MPDVPSFASERTRIYTQKLRAIQKELPAFCGEFFRGTADTTSVLSRYGYALDLHVFFRFLTSEIEEYREKKVTELTLADLNAVRADHIELFMAYLDDYEAEGGHSYQNHERAKARKIAALRSLLKYFFKKEKISSNVASLIDTPKLHEKPILRLEANEAADLLDAVDDGKNLSPGQQKYHAYTGCRDTAIITLFLGTGIRISELVGLNIQDLDFETNGFRVTRKGGNQVILYFSDEVALTLCEYLAEREQLVPLEGHENALFLSMQKRRITPRAVQNLVKKYSSAAVPLKKITPHKLRSTYGTMLYQETGDIYLVADVLGHKDVNTTRKHYAAQTDERRRMAARVIKLRED